MKSVGILCARYTSLHEHMPFLEEEVRWVNFEFTTVISLFYFPLLYQCIANITANLKSAGKPC